MRSRGDLQKNSYATMTQRERVRIMLEKALVQMERARQAIILRDFDTANSSLIRAQDIFSILYQTQIPDNPDSLQARAFLSELNQHLFEINIRKDSAALDEIITVVKRLVNIYTHLSPPVPTTSRNGKR